MSASPGIRCEWGRPAGPGLQWACTGHPAARLADTLHKTGVDERANVRLMADRDTPPGVPECATDSAASDLLSVRLDTGLTSAPRRLEAQLMLGLRPAWGRRVGHAGHPFCAHLTEAPRWFPRRPEPQTRQARARSLGRCRPGALRRGVGLGAARLHLHPGPLWSQRAPRWWWTSLELSRVPGRLNCEARGGSRRRGEWATCPLPCAGPPAPPLRGPEGKCCPLRDQTLVDLPDVIL